MVFCIRFLEGEKRLPTPEKLALESGIGRPFEMKNKFFPVFGILTTVFMVVAIGSAVAGYPEGQRKLSDWTTLFMVASSILLFSIIGMASEQDRQLAQADRYIKAIGCQMNRAILNRLAGNLDLRYQDSLALQQRIGMYQFHPQADGETKEEYDKALAQDTQAKRAILDPIIAETRRDLWEGVETLLRLKIINKRPESYKELL